MVKFLLDILFIGHTHLQSVMRLFYRWPKTSIV